jgi:hypothetical protein
MGKRKTRKLRERERKKKRDIDGLEVRNDSAVLLQYGRFTSMELFEDGRS